jgi:putative ABC transport system permease protein
MSKLQLVDIQKTYRSGEIIHALKGISLAFRESEFVSILGQSGCGKTTLLNIIGGLDRYDSGDLMLGGLSTKKFKDSDWDTYRNHSIGFIFQNYNLIGHQTVLQNVEIAMTLSGVSSSARKKQAKAALASVGLADQLKKKPNQLSGGQMQRVAIARALVNNPDIILADEPTGALDSNTSVQIMDILKEIAKTRLVIMVTHNGELAGQYSSRIIHLFDGEVQSDSNPITKDEKRASEARSNNPQKTKRQKTSMSFVTATSLSFKNLLTKKGRTIITSFAGSIGIIGVALVLALSTGLTGYINKVQSEILSGFPITITEAQTVEPGAGFAILGQSDDEGKYTDENVIYRYDSEANSTQHKNILTQEYFDYISMMEAELPDAVSMISYSRGVDINLLAKGEDSVVKYATSIASTGDYRDYQAMFTGGDNIYWQEMPDSEDFILSLYDLIGEGSRLPSGKNEVAIIVDEYNRIDMAFFEKLGIYMDAEEFKLTDFIGKTILKVILNDAFYTKNEDGVFVTASAAEYDDLYNNADGVELTITGILRVKESASAAVSYFSDGLIYTTALTDYILENAQKSEIAIVQMNTDTDVIRNTPFANEAAKKQRLLGLGADTTATGINIYPKDFTSTGDIEKYLDAYNVSKADADQIVYTNVSEALGSSVGLVLDVVSYVLIGFAAIALLVSTIMIGIITYVSVLERTKEVGILRSIGARKIDISRVFNAETLIVGFVAGALGILISYLLTLPINGIVLSLANIEGIADLTLFHSVLLILGSMALTLIAGLLPSRWAAKKDPVEALRTE